MPAALVAIVLCVTTVSVIDLYCRWDNEKAQEWFSTGTESLWRGRAARGESASVLYCQGDSFNDNSLDVWFLYSTHHM